MSSLKAPISDPRAPSPALPVVTAREVAGRWPRRLALLGLGVWLGVCLGGCTAPALPPVKVGVLHSRSGALAASEGPVEQATLLALEELQNDGGLLGRSIEVVHGDGASDPRRFAEEAERLIGEEKVDVLFGCWSSASRKEVLPVLERHDHLLFYPLQYEGLEQSPHVVYTGAVPNQQLVPGIKWALDHLGRRFFLVGSDYVYPRTANSIAKVQLDVLGGEVLGELYLPLGSDAVGPILDEIARQRPDVILNTINGDSSQAFFRELKRRQITIPTLSTSLSEVEFAILGSDLPVGHYAVWSYFESVDTPENQRFVQRYRARFGASSATNDPMEAAYFGVKLWGQAVTTAHSVQVDDVRRALGGQSLAAPQGLVSLDGSTQHCWKSVRVGQLQSDGQFQVVWSSLGPVRPRPFPVYRPRADWEAYLQGLQQQWEGQWSLPVTR